MTFNQPRDKIGRYGLIVHETPPQIELNPRDEYGLLHTDLTLWQNHFGVSAESVRHDYTISRVLEAITPHADTFIFYGGTALSRTFLNGLRLSEDIDLLSPSPRSETARLLDEALRVGLLDRFGTVEASPRLQDVRHDTDACVYYIGDTTVQIQLIDAQYYTKWPTRSSLISQRYDSIPDTHLITYDADGFVLRQAFMLQQLGVVS